MHFIFLNLSNVVKEAQPRFHGNYHTHHHIYHDQNPPKSLYILCLSVCLYPINVKTANRSGPNLFWTSRDPREGLLMIEFSKKYASNKIRFLKIHEILLLKSTKFFVCFCFTMPIHGDQSLCLQRPDQSRDNVDLNLVLLFPIGL